jgi:hypothetical protein
MSDPLAIIRATDALIAAARESRRSDLDEDWQRLVRARAERFSEVAAPTSLNVFLYHQTVSKESARVNTFDINNLDHSAFDYEALIRRNISIALWSNPGCRVILATDGAFVPQGVTDPRVSVVRVDLAAGEPMFQRVVTMLAYVESAAFTAPTVFLDSDAFLLRSACGVFSNDFDIGVTYRDIGGQMPINEGVILANARDAECVRRFFRSYVATYLNLERHPLVVSTYGNVRRWRGGQLSINAVSGGWNRYAASIADGDFGGRMAYLPCSRYNLSPVEEGDIQAPVLKRALVLHLKGSRKPWLDRMTDLLVAQGYFDVQCRV